MPLAVEISFIISQFVLLFLSHCRAYEQSSPIYQCTAEFLSGLFTVDLRVRQSKHVRVSPALTFLDGAGRW